MGQATADILRLDCHSVWDWYLSNDLQIRILAISLFSAKDIKTHFTNTCKKKKKKKQQQQQQQKKKNIYVLHLYES